MLKIAIIEDTSIDLENLKTNIEAYFGNAKNAYSLKTFTEPRAFINSYKDVAPDIIFFDIELPGINGINAARMIREIDDDVVIVFTTRMAQYALNAYEVNAFDYLLKPIREQAFIMKMRRIVSEAERSKTSGFVWLTNRAERIKVSKDKVVYIESQSHTITWHLEDKTIVTTGTLTGVEESLGSKGFVRCSNCYLVNIEKILKIDKDCIYVDGAVLTISRAKKKDVLDTIMRYYKNGG